MQKKIPFQKKIIFKMESLQELQVRGNKNGNFFLC